MDIFQRDFFVEMQAERRAIGPKKGKKRLIMTKIE